MYVVSGCPRSGTSVMMLCLRAALGKNRVVGNKFPQEKSAPERSERESEEHFQMRKYIWKKVKPDDEGFQKTKDMNPAGFWECPWTVQGLRYLWPLREIIFNDNPTQLVKVVSQGLPRSNPEYVDKVVYMVRDPREVAKSQERLRRGGAVRVQGQQRRLDENMVVRTPSMFTRVTKQAARFFTEYEVPCHLVRFKDLISVPEKVMGKVVEFLGEGDSTAGSAEVKPKLHRSKDQSDVGGMWDEADHVFELLKKGRWDKILNANTSETERENRRYHCPRVRRAVGIRQCMLCYGGGVVMSNMRQRADRQGVDWRNEPCPFECGMCPDDTTPKSIDDSINNNFWEKGVELSNTDHRQRKGEIKRALFNYKQAETDTRLSNMVANHNLPPKIAVEISDSLEEEHE